MAVQVARRQYVTHPGASPAMAGPDGSGARAGSLQRGATGSLEPLILALAQAVDRSGLAPPPGRRQETAS
jgi:hypothetical protein